MGKQVIVIQNSFDDNTNAVLNAAITLANKLHSKNLNSMHLMCAILEKFDDIGDDFKEYFGVDAEEFVDRFFDIESNNEEGNDNIGIHSRTAELEEILTDMFTGSARTGRICDIDTMYNTIIAHKESAVADFLLKEFNVDVNKLKNPEEYNPLMKMPYLSNIGVDLYIRAKEGDFKPITGRDKEINALIDVIGRYDKGSACLIGDPGVGKTAIINELARRIYAGEVPYYLENTHIISVDTSAIVSGTGIRGSFEENINRMLYEASSAKNVILFFDEFHTLMSLGGGMNGGMGAANIMKPALVDGNVKIIGATTTKEYSKFIEQDSAFERRIQPITVDEPSVEEAIKMVKIGIGRYEEYHNCIINDDCISAAVRLADRYIHDRKLPDKAFSVIDQTAAKLKRVINKNTKMMMSIDNIKDTVSTISGIDMAELDENSKGKIQGLASTLKKSLIGQDNAVDAVAMAIKRSKSGIKDPARPIGSFMFVGPTGVGKTELAKQLAVELTGNQNNLIRLDMSEYMEKHTVSRMIGSPPGYVGYGDGGQLTEAVRHNPNSIILFDEVEKAHPDVFNIMLQILDDGTITDSMGRKVSFKDNIIIMTSNAGYGKVDSSNSLGFTATKHESTPDEIESRAIKALEKQFRPEFLNRLDKIVVFNELSREDCTTIAELELNKISKRLSERNINVTFDKSVIDHIVETGYSEKYGARNLKRKAQEIVEDKLADKIIDGEIKSGDNVIVKCEADNSVVLQVNDFETVQVVSMDSIIKAK